MADFQVIVAVIKSSIASHRALLLALRLALRRILIMVLVVSCNETEDQCGEAKSVRRAFGLAVPGCRIVMGPDRFILRKWAIQAFAAFGKAGRRKPLTPLEGRPSVCCHGVVGSL